MTVTTGLAVGTNAAPPPGLCPPDGARDVRGLEETARLFKVSAPTMRRWIADGCPVAEPGGHGKSYKLDVLAVRAWRQAEDESEAEAARQKAERDEQLQRQLFGADMLEPIDGAARRMTKREEGEFLAAELQRIRLAELRKSLVRAAPLAAGLTTAFATARERLRTLPDQLGRQFGWTDAQVEAARDAIDATLTDTVDEIAALMGDLMGNEDDVEAA